MTLCPECRQPFSESKMCEECGIFYDEPEYIVYDLYNYNARPQRLYNRLDHFKEVLGQFQGREGKHIPPEILHQIKYELLPGSPKGPVFSPYPEGLGPRGEVTAVDVKKAIRKLKLTKVYGELLLHPLRRDREKTTLHKA